MSAQMKIKLHTVTTTTLVIDCPQNYSVLQQRFRLVRYIIPDTLLYRKNSTDFGRVHNTVRDQIDYPYKSFQYDSLDGQKNKKWAIYVLYPREATTQDLTLSWFNDSPLTRQDVLFSEVPLHLLMKLLQTRFFRGEETSRFVGQDKCYVYAQPGGDDFHYCVEIELQGVLAPTENIATQEIRVIPHARRFGKVNPPFQPSHSLFGKRAVKGKTLFLQLQSGMEAQEPAVYEIVTIPGMRAQVKYHNPRNFDASKGKIVYDFVKQFLADLEELGITGHKLKRTFKKVQLPKIADLPIHQLETVGIYDNRLRRTHNITNYVNLFRSMHPELHFPLLEDITCAPKGGALVLLDAKAEDFDEDGILCGESDPYLALYAKHPEISKQSLNVNTNDSNALGGGNYLNYPMLQPQDNDLEQNLHVALSELYLKCSIIHGTEHFPIPLIPKDLAFVRKRRFNSEPFTTALWFDKNQLHFANLGDPVQSEAFYQLVDKWNVHWDEQFDQLHVERQRSTENGTIRELPEFDIIVGRDLFVAMEDLGERVLYEYDKIEQRHKEQQALYPIAHFHLSPRYDEIQKQRSKTLLTLDQLSQQGFLDGRRNPATTIARHSLTFYKQLLAYDWLLDEISETHPLLSYQELTSGEWLERITRIFGSKSTNEGKYHRSIITRIYKDLGMFLSEKGQDVQLYQGIWYDDTNAFLVGSPTSMNIQGQERAHLIRRFQIMQGAAHFDKEQLLSTMSVLFVRNGQYTVSPYYFHLIDLYVENVLRYVPVVLSSSEEAS